MTVKRPRLVAAAAGAVLQLVAVCRARPAGAHPEFSAAGTNRYVTAIVMKDRLEISDAALLGQLSGGEARRRMDTDGDGRLAADELARARASAAAEPAALGIFVDGVAISATPDVQLDLGGDERTGASPLSIEQRWTVPLPQAPGGKAMRALKLSLVRDPPRLLETEVTVQLGPGLVLLPPSRAAQRFDGPRTSALQDRSVTFLFAAGPGATPPPPRRQLTRQLTVLAVAAIGGVALAVRRYRKRARGG